MIPNHKRFICFSLILCVWIRLYIDKTDTTFFRPTGVMNCGALNSRKVGTKRKIETVQNAIPTLLEDLIQIILTYAMSVLEFRPLIFNRQEQFMVVVRHTAGESFSIRK
jgi:hypothetical protein